jgi:4-hydroxybenzoate polyprenyltransferase
MNRLRKILNLLIHTNIYIGICAVSLAVALQLVETDTFPKLYRLLFIFFSTVAGYSFLRSRVLYTGDKVIENEYYLFAKNNAWLINIQIVVCALIAGFIFFYMRPIGKELSLIAIAVTGLYALPFLIPVKGLKGLRSLGLLKTLFVAVVWVIITAPVIFSGDDVNGKVSTHTMLFNLFYIWALCIVFEIKDEKYDRLHNLDTLPIRLGEYKTKLLALVCMAIALGVLPYQTYYGSLHHTNALMISYIVTTFIILRTNSRLNDEYYYIVADGAMIIQLAFVLVSHYYV